MNEKSVRLKTLFLYDYDIISMLQKDGRIKVEEGLLPEDYIVESVYFDHRRGHKGAFGFNISSATFPELKDFNYPEEIPYERHQVEDDSTGRRRIIEVLRVKETRQKFL